MWKLVLLFEFAAAQCAVTPAVAASFADSDNPCVDVTGTSVADGASCTASCGAGYIPSQLPQDCSGDTGIQVACELGCNVAATAATETSAGTITNVCTQAAGQTWVGNAGQPCTPACAAGYTAGSLATCTGVDGTATTTVNFPCAIASDSCLIRNQSTVAAAAAASNCTANGQDYNSANKVSLVRATNVCNFECGTGYKVNGSTSSVTCSGDTASGPGVYTDFTCVNTCAVDTTTGSCGNADSTTSELADGAVCTASCTAANQVPTQTLTELTCADAESVTLACEAGCSITAPSANGPTGARCSTGKNWLSKDTDCDLACATGRAGYPRKATCTTEGTDVSYSCLVENSCVITRPTNGATKICNEDGQTVTLSTPYTVVAQGSSCTPQCGYGYKASETTIACSATNALNATTAADSVFTCAANHCTVTAPSSNGPAADASVKCGTGTAAVNRIIVNVGATDCKFQCAADYTAYPETASCTTKATALTYACIKSTSCRIARPTARHFANSKANCSNSDAGETFASGVSIIAKDKKCTLQCKSDSSSDVDSITCNADNSIAKKTDLTFKCTEDTSDSAALGVMSALLLLATRL